jgi:hypothetical protein
VRGCVKSLSAVGARHVEAGDLASNALEQMPRLPNRIVLRIDGRTKRTRRIVGRAQLSTQRVEHPDVLVEHPLAGRDRLQQLLAPC